MRIADEDDLILKVQKLIADSTPWTFSKGMIEDAPTGIDETFPVMASWESTLRDYGLALLRKITLELAAQIPVTIGGRATPVNCFFRLFVHFSSEDLFEKLHIQLLYDSASIGRSGITEAVLKQHLKEVYRGLWKTASLRFEPLTATRRLSLFSEHQDKLLQARMESIFELENTVGKIAQNVVAWQGKWEAQLGQYLKESQDEFQKRKLKLEERLEEERKRQKEEYLAKLAEVQAEKEKTQAAFQERKAKLDEREAAMEAASNQDQRRKLGNRLEEKLVALDNELSVTNQTSRVRNAVYVFAILLLGAFGYGLVYLFLESGSEEATSWFFFVRQLLLGAAFGATAVFLLRWTSSWFHRRVEEEMRNKKMMLDVVRADWLVETTMDLKDKLGELPPGMIELLSGDLFIPPNARDKPRLHPAEALVSLLSDTSKSVSVNTGLLKADLNSKELQSPQK